ncbi:MAG: DUF1934 domain-containing protein [Lachnospiraceae bacterium]|nr:DUF1934 domain-containing protein [Lachnospiraceae bacterium]
MKREICISIKGIQKSEEGEELVETAAFGEFSCIGDTVFLKYDELSEEGAVTKTLIKIKNTCVEVTKCGYMESKMVFIPHTVTETDYSTPYGMLAMSLDTEDVAYNIEEKGVRIQITYLLYLNGTLVSKNQLNIEADFCEE